MESSDSGRAGGRDLVVIGASAGGVEALRTVMRGLPSDLGAAVCVVLHLSPGSPSMLAQILDRAGPLSCRTAADGEPLRHGEVVVAPPDRHLVVEDGRIRLTVGPRENGHRPSVDALFRSAAAAWGDRVVGVVLSGTRDDGTVGLAVIQARGGGTIVQDPKEAMYAGMPSSALAHVEPDAVVPSERVAETIAAMVSGNGQQGAGDLPATGVTGNHEKAAGLTLICPECGGVLTERAEAGLTQWACRVGHRYSPESLIDAQAQDVEAAMWSAVRALDDRRRLLERMAEQLSDRGQARSAGLFARRAGEAAEEADAIRAAISHAAEGPLREVAQADEIDAAALGGEEAAR